MLFPQYILFARPVFFHTVWFQLADGNDGPLSSLAGVDGRLVLHRHLGCAVESPVCAVGLGVL